MDLTLKHLTECLTVDWHQPIMAMYIYILWSQTDKPGYIYFVAVYKASSASN